MIRFKYLPVSITLVLILAGCGNLKPDTVLVSSFPDVDSLLKNDASVPFGKSLNKDVRLDGETESGSLEMDSAKWKKELSFIQEINPNQPGYVGAFERIRSDNKDELILKEGEKGSLKKLTVERSEKGISSLEAIIHEDKDVFVYHKEIKIHFNDGLISSYEIDGYQKILMKDTIRFRIVGAVSED
ncbi:MAG: hypothetical protein RIM99_02205 [Cyclobacteriaceae bacterium]